MQRARALTAVGAVVAAAATAACIALVASGTAQGGSTRDRASSERLRGRVAAERDIARAREDAPVVRSAAGCVRPVAVPGRGPACRTSGGLYVSASAAGTPIVTHGPDLVASISPRAGRAGGFGTPDSIVCSAPSRTRHVLLAYLQPSDGAATRGDRSAEIVPQLRQALYDAAALVDRTAGELVPGARRRTRVQCDDDGQATVVRIVLPRTTAAYRASGAGYDAIWEDLEKAGWIPANAGYDAGKVTAVRRLVAYYDADFVDGLSGEGSMYTNADLVSEGVPRSSPLVSRTVRNINNSPPSGSLALVYGHSYDGVPDPPSYTTLLHEFSHTMGAVQNEPATSSGNGHCIDGIDIMCYDDGGPRGSSYAETACPAAGPQVAESDARFDCNGDTYFHPAPPAGSPLATTWNLGAAANQTLSADAAPPAAPATVASLRSRGTGTKRTFTWPAVLPKAGRGYEVSWRVVGSSQWSSTYTTSTSATPPLRPSKSYEVSVGAVGPGDVLGARARTTLRTGADNSPPSVPVAPSLASTARTSVRLRFVVPDDNVAVTHYRVERRAGSKWVLVRVVKGPSWSRFPAGTRATTPDIAGFAPGTDYVIRVRAQDARGNRSAPTRTIRLRTRS